VLRRGLTLEIVFAISAILAVVALWAPKHWVEWRYGDAILLPAQAPNAPVAIVFGAGLRRDGTPTAVLYDRVATGVQLFHEGKIAQLLMSGSRFSDRHDEPAAMKDLAISLGVPAEAILTDAGGTRTLTTCQRAISVFGIERALLVSQSYHLPRALATCDGLGLQATGISADLRAYSPRAIRFWETREIPATLVALLETRLVGKN